MFKGDKIFEEKLEERVIEEADSNEDLDIMCFQLSLLLGKLREE